MAFINQEGKAKIAAALKPILAKYGMKGSLRVNNYTSISLTLMQGPIDFGSDKLQVNQYWIAHNFHGIAKQFLEEAYAAMKAANWYGDSDAMVDHFDTAYYVYVNVGRWDKPYKLAA